MLKRIDAFSSVGLVIAGVVHTSLGFVLPQGNINDLWFAGTGLALSMLGVINLIRLTANMPMVGMLSAITNVIASLYLLLVARMLPAPHVLLVLAMTLIVTLCSIGVPVRAQRRA